MNRRAFVTGLGAVLVAARGAEAQQQGREDRPARAEDNRVRIALLGSGAAESSGIFVDALRQGLHDTGLVESRDYVLDVRWAEGDYTRFPALARDVILYRPKVILATTIAAVRAAQG